MHQQFSMHKINSGHSFSNSHQVLIYSRGEKKALGLACLFLGLRVRHHMALGQKIIIFFFSINIFNDNKYNNFCTPNNNIFLY